MSSVSFGVALGFLGAIVVTLIELGRRELRGRRRFAGFHSRWTKLDLRTRHLVLKALRAGRDVPTEQAAITLELADIRELMATEMQPTLLSRNLRATGMYILGLAVCAVLSYRQVIDIGSMRVRFGYVLPAYFGTLLALQTLWWVGIYRRLPILRARLVSAKAEAEQHRRRVSSS